MKKLSCVIIDDEIQNQQVLAKMIDQFCPAIEVAGIASSTEEGANLIKEFHPEIVFLDIEIPKENGFTLFDKVLNEKFHVIFTTAHADYAIKAIKFAALDYLLKPISLVELRASIEKVLRIELANELTVVSESKGIEAMQKNHNGSNFDFQKIALPTEQGIALYNLSDITRCQADKAYCIFHFSNGNKVVASKCLKEYETLLSEANFFRVHKSNMVNIDHIDKYVKGNGGFVIMSDGQEVAVSVRKKKPLLEKMSVFRGASYQLSS